MTDAPDFVRNAEARPAPQVTIDAVRAQALELRELYEDFDVLHQQLLDVLGKINKMESRDLLDLLNQAKMPTFTLEADGNHPQTSFTRKNFYSASIPEDKEAEANRWLEAEHPEVLRYNFKISYGVGDAKQAKKVQATLDKMKVDYDLKVGALSQSVTALVKREVEAGRKIPLDLLGATVGEVVEVKFDGKKPSKTLGKK